MNPFSWAAQTSLTWSWKLIERKQTAQEQPWILLSCQNIWCLSFRVKPDISTYHSVYELVTHAKIKIKPKYRTNTVHLHFPSKQKVFPDWAGLWSSVGWLPFGIPLLLHTAHRSRNQLTCEGSRLSLEDCQNEHLKVEGRIWTAGYLLGLITYSEVLFVVSFLIRPRSCLEKLSLLLLHLWKCRGQKFR